MSDPLVSVLIPAFNAEQYISDCVNSVREQAYDDWEIIVVDDGSTDGTLEVLSRYHDVKVVSQAKQGACVARNRALAEARGTYIKFLDADDFLQAGALRSQVDALQRLDSSAIVYGDYSILREGSVTAITNTDIHDGEQLAQLIMANIMTSTPLHRRQLLEKVGGFDARFRSGQEWNLHVRLAAAGARFIYQPEHIYTHRVHFAAERISIKRRYSAGCLEGEVEKVLMTLESVRAAATAKSLAAFSAQLWGIGRSALREGQEALANRCFELARDIAHDDLDRFWPTFYKINYHLFGVRAAERISQLTMRSKKSLFY